MTTRSPLWLAPAGLLFAWSAPWVCTPYTLADGGVTYVNPAPDASTPTGSAYASDASIPVVADGGQLGIIAADGGGVTVGAGALFATDFVYASNYRDGTISRVVIPSDAGAVPYEQARYASVVPENNHCTPDHVSPSRACDRIYQPWQSAGTDQLNLASGVNGSNSPSRTVVDRLGNVVVALRAPGRQAGVTRIINVGDHLAQCHVRCHQRQNLVPDQVFTEGIPLHLSAGGTITLLPSPPPAVNGLTAYSVLPEAVIAAGTSAAVTYACQDTGHTDPTDDTDPVNYDDCIDFSVALGCPSPDPEADPAVSGNPNTPLSCNASGVNTSFGRACAISPHCNPASGECDTWVGMWNGAAWLHLSNGDTSGGATNQLFDVVSRADVGVQPYGGTVDCAGVLWGTAGAYGGQLSAVTTQSVPLPDGTTLPGDFVVAKDIPNVSACSGYGISSDTSERIWIAGWSAGSRVCSFNAGLIIKDYPSMVASGCIAGLQQTPADVSACTPAVQADFASLWQSYSFPGVGGLGRGVNVDKTNNVYQGLYDGTGAAALSMNPDLTTGTPISCSRSDGLPCVDKNFNPSNGSLIWAHQEPDNTNGNGTVGVDLDAEGNLWLGQLGGDSAGHGTAVRLDQTDGHLLASVEVGSGLYSYSDFTGYALREITLSSTNYSQSIMGCGVAPELTSWTSLSFADIVPPGTDIAFTVTVTNSIDPGVLSSAKPYPVCASVQSSCSNTTGVTPTGGTLDLTTLGLPQGTYLTVYATLIPQICQIGGGGTATAKPVLTTLAATQTCSGS